MATPEQLKSAGAVIALDTQLDLINTADDLRTDRDRCLPDPGIVDPMGGAVAPRTFLAMIYLSMPPWPGLPPNPKSRGALLHRQQEPDRADRLPGDRHHAERPLDRARCLFFGARRRRDRPSGAELNASPGTDRPTRPSP